MEYTNTSGIFYIVSKGSIRKNDAGSLFKFFGISTNGFRIAGGVIIFKIGFDMLQARYTPMKLKDEEIKTYADDISITPLGIPDVYKRQA